MATKSAGFGIAAWAGVGVVALAAALLAVLAQRGTGPAATAAERGVAPTAVPIGVLGDSDSSSYQGDTAYAADPFRASRLQWTEVLVRLRGDQLDLGPWGTWGLPRWMALARLREALGQRWRGPRRTDYRHDLAWSSTTDSLVAGGWRQAERLADVMDEDPAHWRRGIVIIRMGVNDFGKDPLDDLARDPAAPAVLPMIDGALDHIRGAIDVIRARHPQVRFVLVGIFDNTHWPGYFGKFRSPEQLRNIARGLDRFDDGLRRIAASAPGIVFFDDRAWFAARWGGRGADGGPAYRTVCLGPLGVTNTEGDDPRHAVLANGHAGFVWNVLWAQALVELLHDRLQIDVDLITSEEAARFAAGVVGPGVASECN